MESRTSTDRMRSLAAPAAVAVLALSAAVVLHVRDPHDRGSYGVCPMYALTGWWCPACGGLRAINDLTDFDFGAAVSSNILIVPGVVLLMLWWIRWVRRRWRGAADRGISLPPAVTIGALGVVLAFTVVRNTAWGSWLAPA